MYVCMYACVIVCACWSFDCIAGVCMFKTLSIYVRMCMYVCMYVCVYDVLLHTFKVLDSKQDRQVTQFPAISHVVFERLRHRDAG